MVKNWTQEEIDFLKKNHKFMTHKKLANKLGKTSGAVNTQVFKLKLPKKHKAWTKEELKFLKENYYKLNNKEIIKKINHSYNKEKIM